MDWTDHWIETYGGDFEVRCEVGRSIPVFRVRIGSDREAVHTRLLIEEARALRDWLTIRIEENDNVGLNS